jgi:hypothetical protein
MGRLKSNTLGSRNRHSPTRDSRDSDGRPFGSRAAFKLAIKPWLKKNRSESFRKAFTPRLILLFQKMRGWLSHISTLLRSDVPSIWTRRRSDDRGVEAQS